jgi:hypothetical protein
MAQNKFPRLSPFDTRTKFVEDNPQGSGIARPHTQWLQKVGVLINQAPQIVDVPATLTSPGVPGDMAFDHSFVYGCIAPNVWKKVAWM